MRILFIFLSKAVFVCLCFCVSCGPSNPEIEIVKPFKHVYEGQPLVITDSLRVLVIGNSITSHPPLPNDGWYHNWGMAASAEDKDFVHVLFNQINTHAAVNGKGRLRYENIAVFERDFYLFDSVRLNQHFKKHREYNPHLVIFRWGDNVSDSLALVHSFKSKFSQLIKYFKQNDKLVPCFIITSSWYANPVVNQQMLDVSKENKTHYIDLGGMRDLPGLTAEENGLFLNGGVASHPSDRGMQAIASSIYEGLQDMIK
jgi:hypothetical protein